MTIKLSAIERAILHRNPINSFLSYYPIFEREEEEEEKRENTRSRRNFARNIDYDVTSHDLQSSTIK